jgi:molybdopterin/thiamine biosynthesis adenylyltransferase
LQESDIGKPRAQACYEQLAQLNFYVDVRVHDGEITEELLRSFQVVVVANPLRFAPVVQYNQFCRTNGIRFILGMAYSRERERESQRELEQTLTSNIHITDWLLGSIGCS